MRRAGRVVQFAQNLVVVRCEASDVPDLHVEILDERLEAVGEVVDVIGPTERPYLVVHPSEPPDQARLLNAPVYRS